MPEQFELDFTAETKEEELARLSKEYKEKVGVAPGVVFTKEDIMKGITHPEKERSRLMTISRAEDDEEMKRTYVR